MFWLSALPWRGALGTDMTIVFPYSPLQVCQNSYLFCHFFFVLMIQPDFRHLLHMLKALFLEFHKNLTFVNVYLTKNVCKFWRSFAKFNMIHISSKIYKLNILDLLEIEHSGPSQRHDNSEKKLRCLNIMHCANTIKDLHVSDLLFIWLKVYVVKLSPFIVVSPNLFQVILSFWFIFICFPNCFILHLLFLCLLW